MTESLSRREFVRVSSAAAWAGAVSRATASQAPSSVAGKYRGVLCFFSKPVPQLNWHALAQSANGAGFGGIDLTVRRGGHVLPDRVREDLPKAVAAVRDGGLEVPMITTELISADDPTAEPVLSTAGKLSIPFVKPGYYRYKFVDVRKELEEAGEKFRLLAALAQKHGVQLGYHNHSGYVGAPVWDMARIMDTLDPKCAGYYFDLQHATSEGGVAGWRIAANLVMPRMKMVAVKDFYWQKEGTGWREKDCPLGQGMCRYKEFLKMAAHAGFHGPISLHLEFQTPGVSDGQRIALSRDKVDDVMAFAKENLNSLKALLRVAYEEPG
jgi:sugar phosphate isomerase/epimerase